MSRHRPQPIRNQLDFDYAMSARQLGNMSSIVTYRHQDGNYRVGFQNLLAEKSVAKRILSIFSRQYFEADSVKSQKREGSCLVGIRP